MRSIMIEQAHQHHMEQLASFARNMFVCVCMDAGSVGIRLHFVDFVVACNGQEELAAVIPDGSTLDADGYRRAVITVLEMLSDAKLRVSAFVGDGLLAQKNVFNRKHPKSLYADEKCRSDWNSVMFMPCWIHRIQLVFRHMFKTHSKFQVLVESLKTNHFSLPFRSNTP